jgi:uncharacterized protein (TIGR00730 family)
MFHETLREDQFLILNEIQEEYREGMLALNSLGDNTVTFYGGARVEENSQTYKDIYKLATEFAKRGWGVVTGGGPGVMKAALSGAKDNKGKAIAFMISISQETPFSLPDIGIVFDHFSVRKYMLRQSDVFIYAPGGIGTLDELMENLTLMATKKSPIKPIFLFDKMFWNGYMDWFEDILIKRKLVNEDFMKLFHLVDSEEEVINILFHS